jgi:hypothetical protein
MLHDIVVLKDELDGIPKFAKGTIIFEYSKGVYEVEFMIHDKSYTLTLTDEDIILP